MTKQSNAFIKTRVGIFILMILGWTTAGIITRVNTPNWVQKYSKKETARG